MKPTKTNTLKFVRQQLSINPVWAKKALVRIFKENQTAEEQSIEQTREDNGIGFSGVDSAFLSSLAKQYIERGTLSEKQEQFVLKIIPKYAKQVMQMSDETKLKEMVEKAIGA